MTDMKADFDKYLREMRRLPEFDRNTKNEISMGHQNQMKADF
jgi:hypothetical protein